MGAQKESEKSPETKLKLILASDLNDRRSMRSKRTQQGNSMSSGRKLMNKRSTLLNRLNA